MSESNTVREVCYLIGADGEVLWCDDGTKHTLPDSRRRWEAIWTRRSELTEIAHTHPSGPLAFSYEDRTTMQAVWAALGHDIVFSVVTPAGMIRISAGRECERVSEEPAWVKAIRFASGLRSENGR